MNTIWLDEPPYPDSLEPEYFDLPVHWSGKHKELFYEVNRWLDIWLDESQHHAETNVSILIEAACAEPKHRGRGRPRLTLLTAEDSNENVSLDLDRNSALTVERKLRKFRPWSRQAAFDDSSRVRKFFSDNRPLLKKLGLSGTADLADEIAAVRWGVTSASVRSVRNNMVMRRKRAKTRPAD